MVNLVHVWGNDDQNRFPGMLLPGSCRAYVTLVTLHPLLHKGNAMNEPAGISTLRGQVVNFLSLDRNVSLASAAVFILGLGEELWKKFVPKYLEALGASTPIVGLYGTAEDFFDAVYQYPGGWLADHLGR